MSPIVSLQRPRATYLSQENIEFAKWADSQNIPIEYGSMLDLENNPSLLNNYKLVVMAGKYEYWSRNMRVAFDDFTRSGGNAMILSGDTMWWQIRIENNKIICYKDPTADPLFGINNSLVTTNWYKSPVNDPENTSIGVSWRNGGFVNQHGFYLASDGYGGYTVSDASHWLFDGTGLHDGDVFGQADTIVGYEADGAAFTWVNGKPVVTGEDGTPLDFDILAYSRAGKQDRDGYATMGIFRVPGGGTIFNAATIEWADGLWSPDGIWTDSRNGIPDPTVSRITLNAIHRFSTPVPEPLSCSFVGSAIVLMLVIHRGQKTRFGHGG